MTRSTRLAAAGAVALALLGTGAVPAAARPGNTARHFSAGAASFVGADTVAERVARLESVAPELPQETTAYGAKTVWNNGITGDGSTVATVVSFGDSQVRQVLDDYSRKHGLPPADVDVLSPSGPVPACTDPGVDKEACESWRGETDLDVTMIHAMAPSAKIVVAATPVAETEGFTGLPEMMHAVDYLTEHRIADVVSFSFGTTEENFPSLDSIKTLDPALRRANRSGVSLVASSGDDGATSPAPGNQGDYPFRAASWPAADPFVTSVGGTSLSLDENGKRTKPDELIDFSGGGFSKVYKRPAWQNRVADITGSPMRSFPDITMKGEEGTSQSAPLFAGSLALAVQAAGHRLGQINPALYRLGAQGTKAGIVDVTKGANDYAGVPGFRAGPGFDVASGWGTPDLATFVPALSGTSLTGEKMAP
ncbi:S53 family peptidase [Sciscionella marina]|uniref:S53 family peptidase n=1 Tax=Sciscionella marina TaxID=508770 RepID=UPI00036D45C8|nr:S53 family peptidase [Sciscionella marina]